MPLNPQAIPLPQSTGGPQFTPPTGIIQDYVNRMPPAQVATQSIGQGIGALAQYQQYQQSRQLEALKAISELYGAGGPGAVQQYAPTLNRAAGTNLIDTSQGTVQANAPIAPSASNGGGPGVPTFAAQTPQMAQTLSPSNPMPMGQGGTGGSGTQPGGFTQQGNTFPQGFQPSEHIMNSVNAGAPDFTGHLQRLNQLKQQMAGFANQGKYGQTQTQQVAAQMTGENEAFKAQTAPTEFARTQQELANAQQNARLATAKPVAEEVSKEGDTTTRVGQLRGLYNQMVDAVGQNKPGLGGAVGATAYNVSRGFVGNKAGADIQNISAPMTAALNYELTKRFNEGEASFLMNSMMPKAGATSQYNQDQLGRLNQMISALESGNVRNIQNVANIIKGSAALPAMGNQSQAQAPQIPQGRITVVSPTGQIGHIPQSQLKMALSKGYKQQ